MVGLWFCVEDGVFLFFLGEWDCDGNSYVSFYGEYGLLLCSMLGFELGCSNVDESSVMLWWQCVLDWGQGLNCWMIFIGIGMLDCKYEYLLLVQMGVVWGCGLDMILWLWCLLGGGWFVVELCIKVVGVIKDQVEMQEFVVVDVSFLVYIIFEMVVKFELIFGWYVIDSLMLINQLQFEDCDDIGFFSKFVIFGVCDLWGFVKLELGVIVLLFGLGEVVVKLGSWLEF